MYHVPGKHFDNAHYRSFSWMGVAKAMSLKKQCQHLLYYSVNRDIVRILRNPRENTHAPTSGSHATPDEYTKSMSLRAFRDQAAFSRGV